MFIFGPSHNISTGTGLGCFENAHVFDERHLGHEMFHMWQGSGNRLFRAWRFIRTPSWLMEGICEFFGVAAHLHTGAFTFEEEMKWRVSFFDGYKDTLMNTSNDVPLDECVSLLEIDTDLWLNCNYSTHIQHPFFENKHIFKLSIIIGI